MRQTASETSRWRRLAPLAVATMATQSSMAAIGPLVVEIGREFDATVGTVGQARTVNAAAAVLASLAVGPLVDRLGVRPLLVWGGVLALAAAAISAAAPSLAVLYAAQGLGGLGVAAMLTGGFAGVAASFRSGGDQVWAMGYVVAAQSLAWVVGIPLIGILAEAVSWRLSFAVPAAAGLLCVAIALVTPVPARAVSGARGGLLAVLRTRSARNWTLAEAVAYAAWTSEITYIGAFYITTYDVSTAEAGLLLAAGSAIFGLTTVTAGRMIQSQGRRTVTFLAALGMAAGFPIAFNITPGVGFTMALFSGAIFCAGMRSTASSSLGLAQLPGQPGSMMASRTASAQLGYIVGAGAGGLVLDASGFGTLGFVLSAVMVVGALLVLRVEDPEAEPEGRLAEAVVD